MNVGDLVMVNLRTRTGRDKEKPGLILQIDNGALDEEGWPTRHFLVLTGPRQLWVEGRQIRPFPAASMAQSRRVARRLEKLVIETKRVSNDSE